jgi:hypothetical protein
LHQCNQLASPGEKEIVEFFAAAAIRIARCTGATCRLKPTIVTGNLTKRL